MWDHSEIKHLEGLWVILINPDHEAVKIINTDNYPNILVEDERRITRIVPVDNLYDVVSAIMGLGGDT